MKNKITLLLCLVIFSFTKAQEGLESKSKFSLSVNGKVGASQLNSLEFKNLSGSVIGSTVLGTYYFNEKVNISTGVGLIDFSANIVSNNELASLQNQYLHIPVRIGMGYNLDKTDPFFSKTKLIFGFGLFGNYHLKQTVENIDFNNEDKGLGWHFGAMIDVGIQIDVAKDLAVLIFLESHFVNKDLANNDEMRLQNNMVGLGLVFKP